MTVSMIGSRGLPEQAGGVERVLEAVCVRLVESGRAGVTVYCANWLEHDDEEYRGVRLRRVRGPETKYGDTLVRSMLATFREMFRGSDVVHYHSIGSAPLALLPRLTGKKVVVTVHALDWQRAKWNGLATKLLQFGEWAAVRFPHETIAVGQEIKEYLEERYDSEVTYIPNGAEKRVHVDPSPLIEDHGLRPGAYALFVGRLVPEKGVHLLVEAIRQLPDLDAQVALVGPDWYELEYTAKLKEMIGDDERIKLVGTAGDELLAQLYSGCAVFVLPSDVEGMSLSMLDALAYGNAIVTSSIPPNRNLVGDAAVVFEAGNVDALRDALEEVFTQKGRMCELRKLAVERSKDYDWDGISAQWADVYDRLVD
ncbi:MAG: glycosyltransferase family 4 protein [Actinomycetota bacterium]